MANALAPIGSARAHLLDDLEELVAAEVPVAVGVEPLQQGPAVLLHLDRGLPLCLLQRQPVQAQLSFELLLVLGPISRGFFFGPFAATSAAAAMRPADSKGHLRGNWAREACCGTQVRVRKGFLAGGPAN